MWEIALITLVLLAGCAGNNWSVIKDVGQIAAMRNQFNTPSMNIHDVTVLRMTDDSGKRVEITSVAPSTIGAQKDGAPAAKTTFTFSNNRDKLILFTQDVAKFLAFHKEIPFAELKPGKKFSFPVVQESGAVLEKSFTVDKIIVQ